MKTSIKSTLNILCIFALCLSPIQLIAKAGTDTDTERPQREGPRDRNGVPSIERFLYLSDEQLDKLMEGIERIRAMTPEERKDFAEEMRAFRRLPTEQRERIRERMRSVSREDHEDIRKMIESMRPRERRRMLRDMRDLDPEERMDYRLKRLEQWRQRQSE
ncbi:MAG: DUF3106 domain-containing protein [Opitutales bacterium]|nr:DUF3106 domain-containing protein [Opitutales bacterium]